MKEPARLDKRHCHDIFSSVWPFSTPKADPPGTESRLETLEDRVSRLERRFTKLQGEVSQAWRDRYLEEEEIDDAEG